MTLLITESIVNDIQERWPGLLVDWRAMLHPRLGIDVFAIDIHWSMNQEFSAATPSPEKSFFVATIYVRDGEIALHFGERERYKNTLSNPSSLDTLFDILTSHLHDIANAFCLMKDKK
jgi:hypothetical protein